MDSFDTILAFVQKSGQFAVLSTDVGFISMLRKLLLGSFALAHNRIRTYANPSTLLQDLAQPEAEGPATLYLIDRMVGGKETAFAAKRLRRMRPQARMLVLSEDRDPKRLLLYHELGADAFLFKPASEDKLMQRLACVLAPPGKLRVLRRKGDEFIAQGKGREALNMGFRMLAESPEDPVAFQLLGDAHLALGRLDKAAEAYLNAVKKARVALEPLGRLAELYRHTGDVERRLKILEAMDRLCDQNLDRKVDMGGLRLALGQEEAAAGLFGVAERLAGAHMAEYLVETLCNIGEAVGDKDPVRAETYFRKALEAKGPRLDKEDIATINRLGLSLRRQGQWRKAVREYQRALSIAQDPVVLYNIALALAEGHEYAEAGKFAKAAVRHGPKAFADNPTACSRLAHVFLKAGEQGLARQFAAQALELDPAQDEARKVLAQAHGPAQAAG